MVNLNNLLLPRSVSKTVSHLNIRRRAANADDEPFLYDLYSATREEEVSAWGLSAEQRESFLKLQFTARQRHYDIAFAGAEDRIILIDERPAGRILVFRSELEIRLVDIALLPEHQGRGAGAFLLKELIEEARTAAKSLTLHVGKLNPAVRLYQRLGFAVVSDVGGDYKMEWRPTTDQTKEST